MQILCRSQALPSPGGLPGLCPHPVCSIGDHHETATHHHPLLFAAALLAGAAHAQTAAPVAAEGAWARASVPGQKATGAFMRLTASEATRLVRAESPAAGVTEVHEMKMEGDVMKMRAVPALDLPAGKAVELKPGGYHVMLMDLKAPWPKALLCR